MTWLHYALDRVAEALEWHSYTLCRARRCWACERIARRDDEPVTDESGAYLDMRDFVPTARARYQRKKRHAE